LYYSIIMLCTVFVFRDCSNDICISVLYCVCFFCLCVAFSDEFHVRLFVQYNGICGRTKWYDMYACMYVCWLHARVCDLINLSQGVFLKEVGVTVCICSTFFCIRADLCIRCLSFVSTVINAAGLNTSEFEVWCQRLFIIRKKLLLQRARFVAKLLSFSLCKNFGFCHFEITVSTHPCYNQSLSLQ
jgi:hypothetical protein